MLLGTVTIADAEEPAVAKTKERLDKLEAFVFWICPWVDEGEEATDAVGFGHQHYGEGDEGGGDDAEEVADFRSAKKEDKEHGHAEAKRD